MINHDFHLNVTGAQKAGDLIILLCMCFLSLGRRTDIEKQIELCFENRMITIFNRLCRSGMRSNLKIMFLNTRRQKVSFRINHK